MTTLGPVSAFLEEELRTWVRRHGIVVWLDLDQHYTTFIDALAERRARDELPYAVHGFRGSHLALMMELEQVAGGVEKTPLVLHLPGHTEDSVRRTPLLELYSAGVRFRKKLDTLITEAAAGRVRPEQITAFKAGGVPSVGALSVEAADHWLSGLLGGGDDLVTSLRAMSAPAVLDDLLGGGFIASRLRDAPALAAVWDRLAAATGLSEAWRAHALPPGQPGPQEVAFAVASWTLAAEYVDDLVRPPVDGKLAAMAELPRPVLDACRTLAGHLRERHRTFYKRTADETEGWLQDEVEVARAEDLGKIDTFRFEEDRVLAASLVALADERWAAVAAWSGPRVEAGSFWLREEPARRSAWQLVHAAATLGQALSDAGVSLGADTLDRAVDRYLAAGVAVDQAHRHLEQRRAALLQPQLPEFEELRARLDWLRELWRTWADNWAREFNAVCRRQGFLPREGLQQRALFEEVVRPLTKEAGATALFVVDALRYEMGEELFRAMDGTPATTVHLKPRLAELPSVTEVGMNVLAPVAPHGRLRPAISGSAIKGFSTGEFRVMNPATRNRAMWDRVGGATCPWLDLADVLRRDSTSLKQAVARAQLVVVHSREIDDAGEKGVGTKVFDSAMQELRAAWRLLRDAGVRRFVFTADHGFLLLDETARDYQAHGRKVDPRRRHVLSTVAADHTNEVRVAMTDLGYEGTDGLHLMFPESTAVFDVGNRAMSFVHGGNSLQERVIPVLTVVHRAAAGSALLQYAVTGEAQDGVAGMHCLSGRLDVVAQGALAFGGTRTVDLALRVADQVEASVELCHVRGGATLTGGAIAAEVGADFELFFKLSGAADARVRVELHHSGAVATVTPFVLRQRFAVSGGGRAPGPQPAAASTDAGWLDELPEGGVRQLFEHLAAHGTVTEAEALSMLGGGRALRRFSGKFEEFSARAPFSVRIDAVAGVKRYVREGGTR